MKRMLLIGLCVSLCNLNCGDSKTLIEGTGRQCADQNDDGECDPVGEVVDNDNGGGEDLPNCGADVDCPSDYMVCEGETVRGHRVGVCAIGCHVEKKTEFGTSCRIAGTDSCQRDGDDLLHCDESNHTCRYLTEEEQADGFPLICDEQSSEGEGEGSEGEGEGADIGGPCTGTNGTCEEPTPGPTRIRMCWNGVTPGVHKAQGSWSTSRASYPEAWAPATDLDIDQYGCAEFSVLLSTVTVGFWGDVTTVPRAQARGNQWLTINARLIYASMDGVSQPIRYFEYGKGWRFGRVGGDDPGCGDNVSTCNAPGR